MSVNRTCRGALVCWASAPQQRPFVRTADARMRVEVPPFCSAREFRERFPVNRPDLVTISLILEFKTCLGDAQTVISTRRGGYIDARPSKFIIFTGAQDASLDPQVQLATASHARFRAHIFDRRTSGRSSPDRVGPFGLVTCSRCERATSEQR
jgi:hypothetical protein